MNPWPGSFLPSLMRGDARQRKGGVKERMNHFARGSLPDRCRIAAGSPLLQAAVAPVGFERVTNKLLPCEA